MTEIQLLISRILYTIITYTTELACFVKVQNLYGDMYVIDMKLVIMMLSSSSCYYHCNKLAMEDCYLENLAMCDWLGGKTTKWARSN